MKIKYCWSVLLVAVLCGCGGGSGSGDTLLGDNKDGSNTGTEVTQPTNANESSSQTAIRTLAKTTSKEEFKTEVYTLYKDLYLGENLEPITESKLIKDFFDKYGLGYTNEDFKDDLIAFIDINNIKNNEALKAKIEAYYESASKDRANLSPSFQGISSSSSTNLLGDLDNSLQSSFSQRLKKWFRESFIGSILCLYFDCEPDGEDDPDPQNNAPVALAQSLSLNENSSISVILSASDEDGDALTYIVNNAEHGNITGFAPNLNYTPNADYSGSDSFSFKVNDGKVDSALVTISFTIIADVTPENNIPVAQAQNLSVEQDRSLNITLMGSDSDGDNLSYSFNKAENGSLSGTAPNLRYMPDNGYVGSDSFSFSVNDGKSDSTLATVSIEVTALTPVNTAPVANAQNISLDQDTQIDIVLSGSDSDGDSLSYSYNQASNGVVSGTSPNIRYTPNIGYSGNDSFTFKVNDAQADSALATVSIEVKVIVPVNNAPITFAQSITLVKNTQTSIALIARDEDGDSLSYTVNNPSNGSLSGTSPNLKYIPNTGFDGSDSFSFYANDGQADSNLATISITITNDAPKASSFSVVLDQDTQKSITLSATDKNGDSLSYKVSSPSNGNLSGIAPNLTYTPHTGYYGDDSFTYKVNDGSIDSSSVTVSIKINEVDTGPNPDTYQLESLSGQVLYVISEVANMTVTMYNDGRTGKGKMGFLSLSFSYNGNNISTSSLGDYVIDFSYIDEGYCIAADAIDEDGKIYKSYWFSSENVSSQANSIPEAKSLCLKNAK